LLLGEDHESFGDTYFSSVCEQAYKSSSAGAKYASNSHGLGDMSIDE
jgi:hypothetical protein